MKTNKIVQRLQKDCPMTEEIISSAMAEAQSSKEVPQNTRWLTMRAIDRWVRAAFLELFRGFEFFPFRRQPSAHPPASTASCSAS